MSKPRGMPTAGGRRVLSGAEQLAVAASTGDLPTVKRLLAEGVSPDGTPVGHGRTPLISAAYTSSLDVLIALLDAGADPNLCNSQGISPLAIVTDVKLAQQLLAAGADPNICDKFQDTPLMVHAAYGDNRLDIINLLLDHGARVSWQGKSMNTALHASVNCTTCTANRVIARLIEAGADPNACNDDGFTPLHSVMLVSSLTQAFLPSICALLEAGTPCSTVRFYFALTLVPAGADCNLLSRAVSLRSTPLKLLSRMNSIPDYPPILTVCAVGTLLAAGADMEGIDAALWAYLRKLACAAKLVDAAALQNMSNYDVVKVLRSQTMLYPRKIP